MSQLAILCFRTYFKGVHEEDLGDGKKVRTPEWTPYRDERQLFDTPEEAQAMVDEFSATNTTMRRAFIVEVNEQDEEALDAAE